MDKTGTDGIQKAILRNKNYNCPKMNITAIALNNKA